MPIYIIVIVLSAVIGLPIVFSLSLGPFVDFILNDQVVMLGSLVQRNYAGINKFVLLAVPLFILAGSIMNRGGVTRRLINLANAFVCHMHGGLAQVNILSSILFAGLSGSAIADTSSLGSILIPAMEDEGYPTDFSAAVTAASSIIGPIIPPSIIMIVYAFMMEVSTGALFAAGVIPGIIMGLGLMLMTRKIAIKNNYPRREKMNHKEKVAAIKGGILPLFTPIIILGGILFSICTATEAAVLAVLYSLILGLFVYKDLKLSDLPKIFLEAGKESAVLLLVIGAAAMFGWVLTVTQIPQRLAEFLLANISRKVVFLLLCNLILFIAGMFLDAGPAIMILGPILSPALLAFNVNPTHFAIVMCVNLTVGLATPPFGLVLFAASTVSKLPIGPIIRKMVPYWAVHISVIFLLTFVPGISLFLPKLVGLPI